jgi:hypothetical protein
MAAYVKVAGVWRPAVVYERVAGVWQRTKIPYVKASGAWVNDVWITKFKEYTIGAQPNDWTKRHVTTGWTALAQTVTGSLSGTALQYNDTAQQRSFLSWDTVTAAADVEILCRFRPVSASGTTDNMIKIGCRASGAAGAETGMFAMVTRQTTGTLYANQVQKAVAGTLTTLQTVAGPSPNWAANNWFWLRFRASGTSFQSRLWHTEASEPVAWDITVTDSSVAAAGWVGLAAFHDLTQTDVDFYGVALNGKTVPLLT